MEDLREQIQDQEITIVGNESEWEISIKKDDLFNEVSARSMYFVKLNSKEPVTSDSNVILDDDRNLCNIYMENAMQELLSALARRIKEDAVVNNATNFTMTLTMSDSHDSNLLGALKVSCKEYLVKRILEQWFNGDMGSIAEYSRITHLLQYRKKSPSRRVRQLL